MGAFANPLSSMLTPTLIFSRATMNDINAIKAENYIGFTVGSATILKELGRGNRAVVFEAYQRTLKRKIAVKILPKKFLTATAAERFQQEAEAAAILAHPNIIPIYEIGETAAFLFMSMQWINGKDLLHYIQKAKKNVVPSRRVLPLLPSFDIAIQVLQALDYAHGQGIVHRDIKPSNILIEEHTRRPLVSDFGTARFLRGDELGEDTIIGTPLYMAPEQVAKIDVDGRADIYAVGVMLFQMLVEKLPVSNYDSAISLLKHKQTNKDGIFLQRPSQLNSKLNTAVDGIISRALAYEPNERFSSAQEFIEALKTYRSKHLS